MFCSSLPPLFFFLNNVLLCVFLLGREDCGCESTWTAAGAMLLLLLLLAMSARPVLLPLHALLRVHPPSLCCVSPSVLQYDGMDSSWRLLLCWTTHIFDVLVRNLHYRLRSLYNYAYLISIMTYIMLLFSTGTKVVSCLRRQTLSCHTIVNSKGESDQSLWVHTSYGILYKEIS